MVKEERKYFKSGIVLLFYLNVSVGGESHKSIRSKEKLCSLELKLESKASERICVRKKVEDSYCSHGVIAKITR